MINSINLEKANELDLTLFKKDLENIEIQYLNLIYDPIFDRVCERWLYEKTINLMEWKCAICGDTILVDKKRDDVENFICDRCKEIYNNKNEFIDIRILKSRTKLYKYLEDRLYEELEDNLNKGM